MTALAHAPRTRRDVVTWVIAGAVVWACAFWLNEHVWDWLIYGALGWNADSRWVEALHFFVYDVTKIALLLSGVIFVVSVLRTFVSIERTRALLGGKREGLGNVVAAGLGVVTPFCSCSAVPVFIGFVGAGVPLGVTFSFLIASPLVNEVAVVLLWTAFGPHIALAYVAAGLLIAIVAGWMLGKARLEHWVDPMVFATSRVASPHGTSRTLSGRDRVLLGAREVVSVLRKVWPYVLVGVGLGALIHGWAPADLVARIAGPHNPLGVPLAVLVGLPLYANAAGALPLVEALGAKGVPIGTLLAFMMSVVALSLPEAILLKRVLRLPLIGIFMGIVAVAIIAVGYLFNAFLA